MEELTDMRVPIKVRSHELTQLQTIVPDILDTLEGLDGLDRPTENLRGVYEDHIKSLEREHEAGDHATIVSMPVEDWGTLVRHLNRARAKYGKLKVHWLQDKLTKRVQDRAGELE